MIEGSNFKLLWFDLLIFNRYPVWQFLGHRIKSRSKILNGTSHFPCGVCDAEIGWEDRGICCATCNIWYHIDCQGKLSTM